MEDEPGETCNGAEMSSNQDAVVDQHTDPSCTMPSDRSSEAETGVASSPAALPDDHITNLSRSVRMHLGQKCKRLIDHGRHQYLAAQGFQVQLMLTCCISNSGACGIHALSVGASLQARTVFRYAETLCCMQVKSVLYIAPDVSGENRLLTASL